MPRLCVGRMDGESCIFSEAQPGKRARVAGRHIRCRFCDSERLAGACLGQMQRANLCGAITRFDEQVRAKALDLIPGEYRAYFEQKLPQRCRGLAGEQCVFALTTTRQAAQVHGRCATCIFCDPEKLAVECRTEGGIHQLASKLRSMSTSSRDKALRERIPAAFCAEVTAAVAAAAPQRAAVRRKPAAAVSTAELGQRWAEALRRRVHCGSPADSEALQKYRKKVLADQARARRQLGRQEPEPAREAERPTARKREASTEKPDNDSGLPAQGFRELRAMVQVQLLGSLRRMLRPAAARHERSHSHQRPLGGALSQGVPHLQEEQDRPCATARRRAGAAPAAGREAFVPSEIDAGGYASGYRQHSSVRWKGVSVRDAIRALAEDDRRSAQAARRYLRSKSDECAYQAFVEEHAKYLAENPGADARQRRAPSVPVHGAGRP